MQHGEVMVEICQHHARDNRDSTPQHRHTIIFLKVRGSHPVTRDSPVLPMPEVETPYCAKARVQTLTGLAGRALFTDARDLHWVLLETVCGDSIPANIWCV